MGGIGAAGRRANRFFGAAFREIRVIRGQHSDGGGGRVRAERGSGGFPWFPAVPCWRPHCCPFLRHTEGCFEIKLDDVAILVKWKKGADFGAENCQCLRPGHQTFRAVSDYGRTHLPEHDNLTNRPLSGIRSDLNRRVQFCLRMNHFRIDSHSLARMKTDFPCQSPPDLTALTVALPARDRSASAHSCL